MSRHRRAFFTIHLAHLPEEYIEISKKGSVESTMGLFYNEMKRMLQKWFSDYKTVLRACAIALEVGSSTDRVHIQGYIELRSARSWQTYARKFKVMETCFQKVRDAPGAWDYCTGQGGTKQGVLKTWAIGEPRLHHHGSETKADLKMCVGYIMEGYHPTYILREHPYAYTVHRSRIWGLWWDMQELTRTGTVERQGYQS